MIAPVDLQYFITRSWQKINGKEPVCLRPSQYTLTSGADMITQYQHRILHLLFSAQSLSSFQAPRSCCVLKLL